MRALIINGPNLDLLGRREPEVYGSDTLADLEARIGAWAGKMGVSADFLQTNSEAEMIQAIHSFDGDGIVLNPAALTHTSRAVADAIAGVETPVVEVHMSNVHAREPWRAESVVAPVAIRTIYGRGAAGYRDALRHLVNRAQMPFETVRYGPHLDNVGDLRLGGPVLAVLVHGGIWRGEHERDSTESLAVDLARKGYTSWNIEYRRLGRGGGWPGSGHDVLTALDTIPDLVTRVGDLDGRVVIVSHSAGSHLAAWAGARTGVPIHRHVALAPLLDLSASVAAGDACAAESAQMLTQGAPTTPGVGDVDTVLVHGTQDQIVPFAHSSALSGSLGLELHQTDTDHFALLDPTKPDWSWVLERLAADG